MKLLYNAVSYRSMWRNLRNSLSVIILFFVVLPLSAATEIKTWTHNFSKEDFIKTTTPSMKESKDLQWGEVSGSLTLQASTKQKFGYYASGVDGFIVYAANTKDAESYLKSFQLRITTPFAGKKINKISLNGKVYKQWNNIKFNINCGVYKDSKELSDKTSHIFEYSANSVSTKDYQFETNGVVGDEIVFDIKSSANESRGILKLCSISIEYEDEVVPQGPKDAVDEIGNEALAGKGENNIFDGVTLSGASGNEYKFSGSLDGTRTCLFSGKDEARKAGSLETSSTLGAFYGDINISGLSATSETEVGIYGIVNKENGGTETPQAEGSNNEEILLFKIPVGNGATDFSGCIPGNYNYLIFRPEGGGGDISFDKVSMNVMVQPMGHISDIFDLENGVLKTDATGERRITGYLRVIGADDQGNGYAMDSNGNLIKLTDKSENTDLMSNMIIRDMKFAPSFVGKTPAAELNSYVSCDEYLKESPALPSGESLEPVYTEIASTPEGIHSSVLASMKCSLVMNGEPDASSGDISGYYNYISIEGGTIKPVFDAFGKNNSLEKAIRKHLYYLSNQNTKAAPKFLFRGIIMSYADYQPTQTLAEGDATNPQYVMLLTDAKNTDGTELSGIDDLSTDGNLSDGNTAKEYYNLQGQKVMQPEKGRIYILRTAGKSSLIIY